MPKKTNPVLGVRMPQEMIDTIDGIIDSGRYRSRGDFVMAAVRLLLEQEATRGGIPDAIPEETTSSGRT